MNYFPIFLQLKNRRVLVVGGGEVACRKVDLLLKANAVICLVSPHLHPYLAALAQQNKFEYKQKKYEVNDLTDIDLVWATTDSTVLNAQIYTQAQQQKIWVNVVDDKLRCDFISPSIVDRTPILVAISSEGQSPVLIRYLREKLETALPQNLSLLADFAGKQRDKIKATFQTVALRRQFWEQFFLLPEVEHAQSERELATAFSRLINQPAPAKTTLTLVLVGQDPELLTLKALRLMQQAEFILFNHDANAVFLDLCRRDANRFIYHHQAQLLTEFNKITCSRICILTTSKKEIQLITTQLSSDIYFETLSSLDAV